MLFGRAAKETALYFYTSKCGNFTGKSLSEALIFAATNPQYGDRLFIEYTSSMHENSKLKPEENMLCTEIVSDIQNNSGKQHVLPHVLQKEELLTKIYL